jgi:hypothetical protein
MKVDVKDKSKCITATKFISELKSDTLKDETQDAFANRTHLMKFSGVFTKRKGINIVLSLFYYVENFKSSPYFALW